MDYRTLPAEGLILECLQTGDPLAWEEFVRRFQPLITTTVFRELRKWGMASPQLIEELVQEIYEKKLCAENNRILREFKPQHEDAFYGFLKRVTTNHVLDRMKALHATKRGPGAEVPGGIETVADSNCSRASAESTERRILLREIDSLLSKVAQGPNLERDRKIFWLYYRVGLAASAIAGLPSIGLETKGVESVIVRLTHLLRKKMEPAREGLR